MRTNAFFDDCEIGIDILQRIFLIKTSAYFYQSELKSIEIDIRNCHFREYPYETWMSSRYAKEATLVGCII